MQSGKVKIIFIFLLHNFSNHYIIHYMFDRLRKKTEELKKETYALYLAYRDPRVPWYAKAVAAATVAYAVSPIDLIPDFIPVLGYLDDLLIVPAGIALSIRLIPAEIMTECRQKAHERLNGANALGRKAAAVVLAVWAMLAALLIWLFIK
jgi:uncharacterized membrane protein YkvA (DUF1232 family)